MTNTGHIQRLWPVFVMLVAIVALPTAGVLWFMNQAMQNERLVVEQRLKDVYQSRLKVAAGRIQAAWREQSSRLLDAGRKDSKTEAFAELVKAGQADSGLLYRNGRLVYPKAEPNSDDSKEPETKSWQSALSLEFTGSSPKAAAEIYEEIVRRSAAVQESAMALIAEARCLNKAGQQAEAIEMLTKKLNNPRYVNAMDAQGRMIQPNALLFALQLMKEPSHPLFQKTAPVLIERLNDYRDPALRSTQRRFLMEQLRSLWPSCPQFPTLAAEELASEFERASPERLKPGQMQPAKIANIWAYETQDESLVALFRQEHLISAMDSALASQEPIQGVKLSVQSPGASDSAYLKETIGDAFPSWRLALILEGPDPFQSATKQKITTYVWTGILMTAGIAMISLLLAGYLQRQVRLTRLKNDLIATVSHELKTPLASMRLLVDTLRDGNYNNAQLTQEYLQMIAKENARLSSLIEGFLTFSRMERNKAKFEQEIVQINEIVHAALEAVGNRLQVPGCRLELDLDPEIPAVIGDRDALITVFVNLLDNALKYTGDTKEIRLRGYSSEGNVWIEVQDNGIGFPRSASKKIFERFYQVDRTLSRSTGGCGLGLSIVQFIVAAHNGSVTAKSQPGKGSTFTVRLPAA